jgi:hypothetical protein
MLGPGFPAGRVAISSGDALIGRSTWLSLIDIERPSITNVHTRVS